MNATVEKNSVDLDFGSRVISKVAWRLIPFFVLAYLLNFIDRVNLGFAALQMNRDLALTATTFGYGAGILFIGYLFFGVPSNIGLQRYGAKRWLAFLLIIWGALSASMSLVANVEQFLVMRFLLGAAEAGFFPGVIFCLTQWFPAAYRASITSRFMFAQPLALMIGSAVSGWLLTLDGTWGIAGWKWMFVLEGIPASLVGIMGYFYLTDSPAKASWLKEEEKQWLIDTLKDEEDRIVAKEKYSMWQAMANPKVWILALIYVSQVIGVFGVNMWLPQIVKSFSNDISTTSIGLIGAIPFVVAAVGMLLIGRSSDKFQERKWHMIGAMVLAGGSLVLCGFVNGSLALSIFLISISSIGFYGCMPIFWTIPPTFLVGAAAATGIAFINAIGNLGGFFGPVAIGWIKDYTGSFTSGLYFMGGAVLVGCLLALVLYKMAEKDGEAVKS
ncbi:MFS transporter [uncultured Anaeromusa sp.]|uniref:MFS transporter n=1 Tax=uncultured Anaeromusa sp. TaxID=673273 RepID=UPI0029C94DC6|nr:MFS transporter [uncultured Anaeromusa sp.]